MCSLVVVFLFDDADGLVKAASYALVVDAGHGGEVDADKGDEV